MLYSFLRPLLFRLDPERAHALSLAFFGAAGRFAPLGTLVARVSAPRHERAVTAFGLRFRNPVGLAAGYDKDGSAWRGLARLGFGHVEVGTVTPRPQAGNPRPRVFRLPADRSLINRLGFPSAGATVVAQRLAGPRPAGLVLGVNLGKQRETSVSDAAADYERLIEIFAPLADYLAINVSSPNTPGLRELEHAERLADLLTRLVARRNGVSAGGALRRPLLVKLSPDLEPEDLDRTIDAVAAAGADGVIATNTTLARPALRSPFAAQAGGLSGAAISERSLGVLRRARERAPGLPVVACGGVMGPGDARARLEAGASLVQIYTGLIYEGPRLARRLAESLA